MVTTPMSASFPDSSDITDNNSSVADLYELSPMQQGMVFHSLYAPESSVYFEQRYCRLRGTLDPASFQQAWQAVVDHYPVLRTAFFWEELEKPLQAVLTDVELPWVTLDWRELRLKRQSENIEELFEERLEEKLAAYLESDRAQGFVLDQAPLMRCTLIQLAEDDYMFVWSHHHALMDGWCNAQLLQGVMAVYDGLVRGQRVSLAPSPAYRNYILWIQQQDVAQAQAFWQQQFEGIAAPTQFRPPVSPRTEDKQGKVHEESASADRYREYHTALSKPITQQLQDGCKRHRLTLNTLVQGAWSLLLSHYSGDCQVVFGATVSGRPPTLPQVESIIGLFINTLPVRVNLSPDAELIPWLQTLQTEQLEREQYAYSSLVDIQSWSNMPRGVPLFDSLIVFENYPLSIETVLTGWDSRLAITDLKGFERTNYPLTLTVIPGKTLAFRMTYDDHWLGNGDRSSSTIHRLWGHLQTILTEFAKALTTGESSTTLTNVPMLTEREQRQQQDWAMVLHRSHPTKPSHIRLVHEWVEAWAEETPDAIALTFESQSLTYRDLNQQVNQLAHHLLKIGVQPDELVGVCLARSPYMLIALLAVHKAGAAYVPIDPTYPQDRIQYVVEDANIKILIKDSGVSNSGVPNSGVQEFRYIDIYADADVIHSYPTVPPQLPNSLTPPPNVSAPSKIQNRSAETFGDRSVRLSSPSKPVESRSHQNPKSKIQNPKSKIAYTIYTSGSTGNPKGVQISHSALSNLLMAMAETPGFSANDRLLAVTTLSFDIAGLELFLPLMCGGQVVIASQDDVRDGDRLISLLNHHDITVMQATPATWRLLLASDWEGKSNLRVLCGGEALDTPLAAQLLAKSQSLWNLYGPTETTIWSLCHQVTASDLEGIATVPIGKAIANTELHVLNQYHQPVPVGIPGELYIGGAGVAVGYLNRPELTRDRFIAKAERRTQNAESKIQNLKSKIQNSLTLYKTGDRVRYRHDGTLEYLGRLDFQVKLRGFRIELGEIEVTLSQHPQVQQAVVVVQQQDTAPMLVAYWVSVLGSVETSVGTEQLDIGSPSSPQPTGLREFLQKSLPSYMVPNVFVQLDALPLTPNGKVDRRALPFPKSSNTFDKDTGKKTPTQEVVIALAAIALNQSADEMGSEDNFFDLGGHSLSATRFASQVRQAFQIELPLRQVFDQPTLGALANAIDGLIQSEVDPGASLQQITPERIEPLVPQPLSFTQQRQWMLWRLEPESAAYNIPLAVKITGELDLAILQTSLNQVVVRHQILRSRFDTDTATDQPVQVVLPELMVNIATIDLGADPPSERQEKLGAIARDEAHRPFDLTTPPLFRVKIVRLSTTEHVLLMTLHHIITDGWSMGVLVNELTALYEAQLAGIDELGTVLPDLPIQYGDFARWQRQWLDGEGQREVLERQLDYWRSHLDQAPILALPTTYPRSAVRSERGAVHSFQLSSTQIQALKRLSQQAGCTLFMTVFAAFNLFLHRYSGSTDIVIGTPIANRHRADVEPLIGSFVNTLALRTDLSGNPTLAELLSQVRDITLDGYAYQDLPFERVLDALDVERSLAYTPLFQVMFSLETRTPVSPQRNIQWTPLEQHNGTAKFDLTVVLSKTDEGLTGSWEYSLDLFDAPAIEQMIQCFQTLLDAMPTGLDRPISELPWLSPTMYQMVMNCGTQTLTDYPCSTCIHELFDSQVAQRPDAIALIFPSASNPDPTSARVFTYRDLNEQANQLAHYLQYQGIGPDTLVGLWTERSPSTILAILAIIKAGGAYVPLDPNYPDERLNLIVTDAQLSLIIGIVSDPFQNRSTERSRRSPRSKIQNPIAFLDLTTIQDAIAHHPITPPPITTSPDNLAYVMYTSGSTGIPKGVCVPHRAVVRLVKKTNYVTLDERQVILQAAPLAFDASTFEIWGALLNGGQVVMLPQQQPSLQDFGTVIANHKITTLWLTAGLFHLMVDEAIANFASVQQVLAGGDVLSGPHIETLLKTYPNCRVINGYGPTEGTTFTCCHTVTLEDCNPSPPIGTPIANTQVYVLDEYLQPVLAGLPGELYITGDGLARGYLNRPSLTGDRFIPNPFLRRSQGSGKVSTNGQKSRKEPWDLETSRSSTLYKTGDRARYRPDGTIEYLGRLDAQVKIRGFRVELGEVEAVLCQHHSIRDAMVILQTDDYGVDRLVAYVVTNDVEDDREEEQTKTIQAFLSKRVPEYLVPARLVWLEHLPLTVNGKVDRRALPVVDWSIGVGDRSDDPQNQPRTDVEIQLVEIWQDVLHQPEIGIHDNFFALGGDSILAIQIVSRARQVGVLLRPKQIFQYQTIAKLGAIATLENVDGNSNAIADQGIVTGPVPLTPIQHWFFAQEHPQPDHFNQAVLLTAHERLDVSRLQEAIAHLLRHHDNLRSRFTQSAQDGTWHHELLPPDQVEVPLTVVNGADLPDIQWQELISSTVDAAHQSLDISKGEVLRIIWFDRGDVTRNDANRNTSASHRLLIVAHHLIIDGVSWRILLEDLQTVYQQCCLGQSAQLPPKTTSIQAWAVARQAQSCQAEDYSDHPDLQSMASQRLWEADKNGTVGASQHVAITLTADQTQALLTDVPLAYNTGIEDVLLTALTGAIAELFNVPHVRVDLEGHGRESEAENVSRTIGWFTTITSLLLDTSKCRVGTAHQANGVRDNTIADALKSVKEQIRQQKRLATRVPDPGVLKEPRDLNPADVSFNYLGQLTISGESELFSRAPESSGRAISATAPRPYALEVTGAIAQSSAHAANQLTLTWTYHPEQIDTEAIETLSQTFETQLLALITHCCSPDAGGHTPSDFPLAQLEQTDLDTLLKHLGLKQVDDIYPLSPMQQGMLFHSLFTPQAGMYAIQVTFDIYSSSNQDTFDMATFEQAWQQTLKRYASLRTAFIWDGSAQPLQVVAKTVSLPIQTLDWCANSERSIGPAEQTQQLTQLEEEERSRDFTLTQAPLMRLVVVQQSPTHHHIIWTYHHLLLDGWSMPIILKEVLTAYQNRRQKDGIKAEGRRQKDEIKAEGRRQKAEDNSLQNPKSKIQNRSTPFSYASYIAWLIQQDQQQAEAFWRTYLAGFTAPTSLRFEASTNQTEGRIPIANQSHKIHLSQDLTQQLQRFCQQHQLTLNTLVQGAFALLLSRYSGESDVLFGATCSGRPPELPGSESMVGLMMNTLPMRVRIDENQEAIAWLQTIQSQQVELQQYEFSSLVDIQRWSEIPRGTPLFESVVVFENYPVEDALRRSLIEDGAALTVENVHIREQTNVPLSLYVVAETELTLKMLFDPNWFGHKASETPPPIITRLLRHLQTILKSLAEIESEPRISICDIALLTTTEQQQLLVDWNQTQLDADLSPNAYIHTRFEAQAMRTPEAIALTPLTPSLPHPQSLTYREVDEQANQLAHHLHALGIQPGELVGVCLERSAEMVIALLAIHKAGAAYLPIDPTYPSDRIHYMIEDADIRAIIQQASTQIQNLELKIQNPITLDTEQDVISRHAVTPPPKSKIVRLRRSASAQSRRAHAEVQNPKSPIAYTIYTSGSTGNPKGVQISHRSLANFLHAMQHHIQLHEQDRLLAVTTLSFDIAALELFLPLMVGGRVAIAPREMTRNGEELVHALEQHDITAMQATPMTWRLLLANGWRGKSDLRILSGGEALDSSLARQLLDCGQELWNLYGPTETTIWSACHKIERAEIETTTGVMPIGRAIANTTFYVLDPQLRPVPVGIPGELYIGGEGVAMGYLNRPELTSDRFIANPFLPSRSQGSIQVSADHQSLRREPWDLRLYRTGDRVRYREDGTLEYLGRLDYQVKLRGFRIELGEIEATLSQHPDIQQTVVTVHSQDTDPTLVAYVVPKLGDRQNPKASEPTPSPSQEGNRTLQNPKSEIVRLSAHAKVQNPQLLRQFLTSKLPQHLVPSRYLILATLPLTPNGKVDRKRLPAPDGGLALAPTYIAPKTAIERAIAQIWQTVLNVETVGIYDNFFDLGGHSLLMVNVHNQLKQEEFGAALTLVDLFRYPTISDLAHHLSQDDAPTLDEQVERRAEKMAAGRDRLKQRRQKRSGGRE